MNKISFKRYRAPSKEEVTTGVAQVVKVHPDGSEELMTLHDVFLRHQSLVIIVENGKYVKQHDNSGWIFKS